MSFITTFHAFLMMKENVQPYPSVVMTAISNTPDAIILSDGSIQLSVSRYQKPDQSGELSTRTGVFYLPEIKSPYGKHYRNNKWYGGKQYITGTIICKKPYIIRAGTGGVGPRKAYTELVGKDKYISLDSDIGKLYWLNGENKVLAVRSLLDKYNGNEDEEDNYDISYDMVRVSKEGNTLRMAIQENVIAHTMRDEGYDSVLSYSTSGGELRLSELFYLLQEYYPEDSGFILPE